MIPEVLKKIKYSHVKLNIPLTNVWLDVYADISANFYLVNDLNMIAPFFF